MLLASTGRMVQFRYGELEETDDDGESANQGIIVIVAATFGVLAALVLLIALRDVLALYRANKPGQEAPPMEVVLGADDRGERAPEKAPERREPPKPREEAAPTAPPMPQA